MLLLKLEALHRNSSHINKLDDSTMNMHMTRRDVNTGVVNSNVATINMQPHDSSISKFLCGTFVVPQLMCGQAEDTMFFLITQQPTISPQPLVSVDFDLPDSLGPYSDIYSYFRSSPVSGSR